MAVRINRGAINAHFQATPLGGSSRGRRRGFSGGEADAIAATMVIEVRANTAQFQQRTNALVNSVIPIVRHRRGGGVEVGVGTTVEHGKWLEIGTDFHYIPRTPYRGYIWDSGSKGEVPEEYKLLGRHHQVPHPGNRAYHWMSDAVRKVIPDLPVHVRVLK